MEKQTPHHNLHEVKNLLQAGAVVITQAALHRALRLGLEYQDICHTILTLSREDFYKSMTAYGNSRSWQDVYRPWTAVGKIYLKLTIQDGLLVLSFKEL